MSGEFAPAAPPNGGDGDRQPASRWKLWQLPVRLRALLLAVETLAVSLVTVDIVTGSRAEFTGFSIGVAAVLVVLSAVHAELSLGAERVRRRIAETRYIDLSSVWTFAAALLLPPLLAGAVVVLSYTHLYMRVFRPAKTPPHRQVFSTSTVVLAVYAVGGIRAVFQDGVWPLVSPVGLVALGAGLLAYTAVNTLLVVSAIRLSQPGASFLAILAGGEIMLEVATLCLGGLVATVVGPGTWGLLLFVLPPLLLLEQSTLVRQLENRANIDAKTGLLNPEAWRGKTMRLLRRAARDDTAAAVLILDLDHFKDVNDRHGHLVGDEVLQAVAQVLASEIRDGDLAGRFGGEEFVIALSGMKAADARHGGVHDVAERIRRRIEELRLEVETADGPLTVDQLSISVGAAIYPTAATELNGLLESSDAALYAAKRAGRNQVQVRGAPRPPDPPPTPPFGLRSTG